MTERLNEPLRPFVEVEAGPVERRRIYAARQDRVQSALDGKELVVDRLLFPDWVNVVAFDDDDALIVVRQWRFGVRAFSVEIPAGALERGEDPIDGGLRELLEETGHTPVDRAAVRLLGATRPNPAFMNNRCFTVFVPRARRTHPQRLDATEEVEVRTIPRGEVAAAVKAAAVACAGAADVGVDVDLVFDNALVVVALQLWALHAGGAG
jgi:ADP-ribose pyrophosphatase